jgi:hypothetical protein
MATISTLAGYVQSRLEEAVGSPGVFWSLQYEIYTAIAEAQSDLMLLVGRPTQIVNFQISLIPNTVWQTVPKGVFQITDVYSGGSQLYKINLWDLDYTQTNWGSDWEQDVDDAATEWAPIGFNMFVVHPAPSVPQTANITAIQYPQLDQWPYDGTESIVFQDEFFVALELYAAHYCRIKETSGEFQNGLQLLQDYLQLARRMSQIQDIRDPLLFTQGFGGTQNVNPATMR